MDEPLTLAYVVAHPDDDADEEEQPMVVGTFRRRVHGAIPQAAEGRY